MTRKQPLIQITPREHLTHKARLAIEAYALHRSGDLRISNFLIKYTLEAERMRREKLYAWLEEHGYKWYPRNGWVKHE
jgi:hypothetical protein